jgi:hypothetical protein
MRPVRRKTMSRPRARYEDPDVPDEALRRAELNRRNFLRAAGIFGVSAAALGTFAGPVAASPSMPGSSKSAKAAGLAIVRGKVFRELKGISPARSKGIPGVAVSDGESMDGAPGLGHDPDLLPQGHLAAGWRGERRLRLAA